MTYHNHLLQPRRYYVQQLSYKTSGRPCYKSRRYIRYYVCVWIYVCFFIYQATKSIFFAQGGKTFVVRATLCIFLWVFIFVMSDHFLRHLPCFSDWEICDCASGKHEYESIDLILEIINPSIRVFTVFSFLLRIRYQLE